MDAVEIDLSIELDDLTPEQSAELIAYAEQEAREAIADDYTVSTVTEAVTALLMFDPSWLFSRRYVTGWVATPAAETKP